MPVGQGGRAVKATVVIEVPTEIVERRLAEIERDRAADGIEAEAISAERFFSEIVETEIESFRALFWYDPAEIRVEVTAVER